MEGLNKETQGEEIARIIKNAVGLFNKAPTFL